MRAVFTQLIIAFSTSFMMSCCVSGKNIIDVSIEDIKSGSDVRKKHAVEQLISINEKISSVLWEVINECAKGS